MAEQSLTFKPAILPSGYCIHLYKDGVQAGIIIAKGRADRRTGEKQ